MSEPREVVAYCVVCGNPPHMGDCPPMAPGFRQNLSTFGEDYTGVPVEAAAPPQEERK